MWTTSVGAFVPYLAASKPIKTEYGPLSSHFPINVVLADSRSRRRPATSDPKQEDGEGIRGSDVLWALQRATAQKKKAKRKKGIASSSETTTTHRNREKDTIDYSNVRPLEIKTEWSLKLDELEKRLQELEDEEDIS